MKAKGRHPEKALSAVRVRAIKEPGRYTDGNGLYLVVDRSGAKRWMLRTVVHGKRCDIGLGGLRLVSLAEAREAADMIFLEAGATAIFRSNAFERRLRDIHTVSQQVQGSISRMQSVGQYYLGIKPQLFLMA